LDGRGGKVGAGWAVGRGGKAGSAASVTDGGNATTNSTQAILTIAAELPFDLCSLAIISALCTTRLHRLGSRGKDEADGQPPLLQNSSSNMPDCIHHTR